MPIHRLQNHPLANRYTASYAIAILLHLLLLLLLTTPAKELFFEASPNRPTAEPLAFEFVESEAEPTKRAADTRYMSDRNAISKDISQEDLPRTDQAYNEGIVEYQGDFETRQAAESDPPAASSATGQAPEQTGEEQSETEQIYKGLESMASLTRKSFTTREQRERSVFGRPAPSRSQVASRNLSSRALEEGGLQLSTYNWNFAPYLKYLKQRIQSHIFPPAAFSRLGMIDGESKVRFRIYPDGRMEKFEVLDSRGSELLLKTSTQAVELSAPFKQLPEDFPEPFLEITGIFAYILYKGRG